MADPYKNLARGERLSKISAPQIAGWNDAARAESKRKYNADFGAGEMETTSVLAKVKNDTGDALPVFAVTILGAPIFTYAENSAEFKYNTALKVALPGAPTDQPVVAILRDTLKDGAIGRATIVGLTPVKIYVDTGEDTWKWANIASGETDHLVMKQYGGCAKVIWKESGTGGEKWALVLLGYLMIPTSAC